MTLFFSFTLVLAQEEEALLNEMEVTGQAFEDMQEQNIRLLQQLREKDDANFKLMSEVTTCVLFIFKFCIFITVTNLRLNGRLIDYGVICMSCCITVLT